MKTTHLIDLVGKYIQLELTNEMQPTQARTTQIIVMRNRIINELDWLQKQRIEALSRVAPDFDKH